MDDPSEESPQNVELVLRDVVAPLITADDGEIYIVEIAERRLWLHLGGRFAGCPGNTLVTRRVIEPLIRAIAPAVELTVTAGALVPTGARSITSAKD
jgi:Fe-S cluster biogenesis protein NfuA